MKVHKGCRLTHPSGCTNQRHPRYEQSLALHGEAHKGHWNQKESNRLRRRKEGYPIYLQELALHQPWFQEERRLLHQEGNAHG